MEDSLPIVPVDDAIHLGDGLTPVTIAGVPVFNVDVWRLIRERDTLVQQFADKPEFEYLDGFKALIAKHGGPTLNDMQADALDKAIIERYLAVKKKQGERLRLLRSTESAPSD